MAKRDTVLLLLLLGAGGYAVHDNWAAISERLGLEEFDPGRAKAVDLAKNDNHFEQGMANWQAVQTWRQTGQVAYDGDPWHAEPLEGQRYRVTVEWTAEAGVERREFLVDIATRVVEPQWPEGVPAAPR